jgi:hypothetical protein
MDAPAAASADAPAEAAGPPAAPAADAHAARAAPDSAANQQTQKASLHWDHVSMALPPALPPGTPPNGLVAPMVIQLGALLEPSPFWAAVSAALAAAEAQLPAQDEEAQSAGAAVAELRRRCATCALEPARLPLARGWTRLWMWLHDLVFCLCCCVPDANVCARAATSASCPRPRPISARSSSATSASAPPAARSPSVPPWPRLRPPPPRRPCPTRQRRQRPPRRRCPAHLRLCCQTPRARHRSRAGGASPAAAASTPIAGALSPLGHLCCAMCIALHVSFLPCTGQSPSSHCPTCPRTCGAP